MTEWIMLLGLFLGFVTVVWIPLFFILRGQNERFDKFESVREELTGKIESVREELTDKIETVRSDLSRDIASLREELSGQIYGLSKTVNQLVGAVNALAGKQQGDPLYVQDKGISKPKNPTPVPKTGKTESPLRLSEMGKDLVIRLNATELVHKYVDKVKFGLAEDAHKQVIQDECIRYANDDLINIVNPDERTKLLDAIYEDGGDASKILFVYGVLFRNTIFKERNIPIPE